MPRRADIDVKGRLLEAGSAVLHARGFNAAGVQEIADAAGVPKGSFYNHFDSKEAFAVSVLDHYWQEGAAAQAVLLDSALPPRERLLRHFRAHAESLTASDCHAGCMLGNFSLELADQSEAVRARLADLFQGWSRTLQRVIREGQAQGDLAPGDPVQLADFLINAWEGAVLRAKVDRAPDALQTFLTTAIERLLR